SFLTSAAIWIHMEMPVARILPGRLLRVECKAMLVFVERRRHQTWRGARGPGDCHGFCVERLSNAQAAPTSRFARGIRVRWRVPLPLHLCEVHVTPLRLLQAVLNRMKCEAEQRAEEHACEAGR